jgi:hypothetical protein
LLRRLRSPGFANRTKMGGVGKFELKHPLLIGFRSQRLQNHARKAAIPTVARDTRCDFPS